MGQTLSSPATFKTTESGGNERYAFAVSEMQGWRISMEDAHTVKLNLDETEKDSNTFFAVYDGHGGSTVAKFAGENVHKRLVTEDAYKEKRYAAALKAAFLGTDEDIRADPKYAHESSGCTAVAALVTSDRRIYLANAGDSRSVISVKGEVKPLSYDHKPQNDTERERITAAGGYIEYGRVNGNLALARAIGDFEFKKNYFLSPEEQIITADPEVIEHEITDEDEFLILACDGVWDCLTSQQVVDIVRLYVGQGKSLSEICELICDHCMAPDTNSGAGIGCDNMTMMVVAILNGRTLDEWYHWVKDRIDQNYGRRTPKTVPDIYAPSRVLAYRQRQQAIDERNARIEKEREASTLRGPAALGKLGKVLMITSDGFQLIPADMTRARDGTDSQGHQIRALDDSEEESGDDDMDLDSADMGSFLGALSGKSSDMTKTLQEQLDELDKDVDNVSFQDHEGDTLMSEDEAQRTHRSEASTSTSKSPSDPDSLTNPSSQAEAPPPPKPTENGDAPRAQLESLPQGDEPSAAVKAEGFLDSSEDPTKV